MGRLFHHPASPSSAAPTRAAFTLVETAFVTAIVGIGIIALLSLLAAGSMANIDSSENTTAVFLANNISEMMQGATYTTLHSTYDDHTYDPPVDGRGTALSGFSGWKQMVNVQYVDPLLLTSAVPDSQVEDMSRVTVTIMHNSVVIYTAKWIAAAPQ